MKILVKTLKGGKIPIEADENSTVAAVKGIIEATNAEFPAESMKLIHSGKVLKDEEVLSTVGIKENDFLVVMITKKKTSPKTPAKKQEDKKEGATPAAAAQASATTAPTTAAAATVAAPVAATSTATSTTTPVPTAAAAATTPAPTTTTTTPAAPSQPAISDAAVENLTGMGFPEEAVRHCLRVAQGNPDLAVEFLTNGIPEGMEQAMQAAAVSRVGSSPTAGSGGSNQPLQALRNHAQFNDLRRLVQSNPQMLQQVLTQIGQQQPELLQEINANQALFLEMMNEPIQESSASNNTSSAPAAPLANSSSSVSAGDNPFAGGMGNPMQMAQMIQSMNPEELNQMAQMMGVSPEQLRTTAQMIGQMPPEQLNQFIMQAMGGGGGGGGGMEGMFGGAGERGPGGAQVLRLTDEEMAAVDRLTEMGFDRAEAAQAFLACDKNEALAANLLMDSMMGDDNQGSGGGGSGGGSGGGDSNNDNNGDDDEEMYD